MGDPVLAHAYDGLTDVQRALVTLETPAAGPADTDAVSYWHDWPPGRERDPAWEVAVARAYSARALAAPWTETAAAASHAAAVADPVACVRTDGHVLRVADLVSRLVLEAVVHHVDRGAGPAAAARVTW